MSKKILQGEIVSLKQPKAAVIKVTVRKTHPKYHKQYTVFRRYQARLPEGEWALGDVVQMTESRPLTRTMRWVVTGRVK